MAPAESACKELDLLKSRYHADLRVYIDAAICLENLESADFEKAFEHAERARRAFEDARSRLNEHVSIHRCA
jgi:hypothetical protein